MATPASLFEHFTLAAFFSGPPDALINTRQPT